MKVEVVVLGSPSLISLIVSVDVKRALNQKSNAPNEGIENEIAACDCV